MRIVCPEVEGLFRDEVRHFFGKEEVGSGNSADAMRVGKGAIEPFGPFDSEQRIVEPPNDPDGTFPLAQIFSNSNEIVDGESNSELIELLFAEIGLCERAEIDLEGLVGQAIRIGEGESTKTLGRARKMFVVQLWNEKAIDEDSLAGEIDQRKKTGWRIVGVDVAICDEQRTDTLRIGCEKELSRDSAAVIGYEIDGIDVKMVQQSGEHLHLSMWRNDLVFVRLRES